jgi:hypothetical protein
MNEENMASKAITDIVPKKLKENTTYAILGTRVVRPVGEQAPT